MHNKHKHLSMSSQTCNVYVQNLKCMVFMTVSTKKSISKRHQNLIFCMHHETVVSEIWEWMTYGYVEGVTAEYRMVN